MENILGEHGGVIVSGIIVVFIVIALAVVIVSASGMNMGAVISVAGE